jgi:acyl carrier protein
VTAKEVQDKLIHEVLEFVSAGSVSLDRKMDSLGLDSLDFVQLHNDIEDDFDIRLPIAQIVECDTVADLAVLIKSKC